jgi:2-oxoglutarate ferredoxin oxidoreductase subunit beta
LTTGQFTALSPKGFKGKSTPKGSIEEPFNPLKIMLASNATFIAQGYSSKINHLTNLIKQGVSHKGFSFIDVLQPCITFFDTYEEYNKKVYEIKSENLTSEKEAMKKISEWGYKKDKPKIPIGIFYKIQRPAYEKELLGDLNPSNLRNS